MVERMSTDKLRQRKSFEGKSALFAVSVVAAFTGCGMHHGDMGDPSSTPIPPIGSEALFVVNGGSNDVTVISTSTHEIVGTISLENAAYPHHIYRSPDRSRLALAIPGADLSGGHGGGGHDGHGISGAILIMDATTGQTMASRRFGISNHNAAFSPDGKEIWTSQMASPGQVLVLDAATLATKTTIEVGNAPAEVTFNLDGKYVFAANGGSNSITVIDADTKAIVKTIAVGTTPVGAWPGRDSIMYVDNEGSKTITAIHGSTLEVVRTYALGFTPGMAATGPKGGLWVTDSDSGKVAIFPAASTVRQAHLAVGAGAHGIAFSGDDKAAYISNQSAGTVSVVDVETLTVKKTLAVGDKPNGMVVR